PPDLCPAHTVVFQYMGKSECHFINGTEKGRYPRRFMYSREQYAMFNCDVGHILGFTPYGETAARYWNSDPHVMEQKRTAVDWLRRYNYEYLTGLALPV
ncbi:HB2L protein, partial [Vidua macroura]|nr:HB2L protein [Vidua macroura]